MAVTLKNRHELDLMRHAGRIVGECHLLLRDAVRPGVTTAQLNGLVHD
jgi:methionyl aminopeptidase